MKKNLELYMTELLPQIEETLAKTLERFQSKNHPLLHSAAKHSLLNPGKRLRPLLTLMTVEALGGDLEKALIPASAIEILHTYSLIHDDLPCMDDDDLRRGLPTLHKLYGEGQAVLVGDLFLTLAFEVLASNPLLSPEKSLKLIQILAERSGGQGMILGQSLDLEGEGKILSWDNLLLLHKRKTADLLSCCLEFGGIIAGASETTCKSLAKIGELSGLSFQIIDDILDAEEGSDLREEKSTSVSLLGIDKAKAFAEELLSLALTECKSLKIDHSPLEELLHKLIKRTF
jgi:geranylgeranyl diphosphate synthase type II